MTILGKPKAIEILLALYDKEATITQLQRRVGGSMTTIHQRVAELKNGKFMEDRRLKSWPFTRTLELTPKGKKISNALKQAL